MYARYKLTEDLREVVTAIQAGEHGRARDTSIRCRAYAGGEGVPARVAADLGRLFAAMDATLAVDAPDPDGALAVCEQIRCRLGEWGSISTGAPPGRR